MDGKITVLVVEQGKAPYPKEISRGLASLQHEVDGFIEAIYPYADPVALVMDECGKINHKPLNRTLRNENGNIVDVIAGTFLVVGLETEDFASLTPELLDMYRKKFLLSEIFISLDGKIVVIPFDEEKANGR